MDGNSKIPVDRSQEDPNQGAISVDVLIRLMEEQKSLIHHLVQLAEKRNEMADRRTRDAQLRTVLSEKRTDLTGKQTEYSSRSAELAEQRTRYAQIRTELAENRTSLAGTRTAYSERRNELASTRTGLSGYRSVLAKGRTELAFIRTGLAFVALGAGLMRYFGFGPWTVLDGGLLLAGTGMTLYALRGFAIIRKHEKRFDWKWSRFPGLHSPPRVTGEGE